MKMTVRRLLRGARPQIAPGKPPGLLSQPSRSKGEEVDHRGIGDNYRDLRQWRDAAEAYTLHLEAHPEDDAIWVQCGNCLKEAGEFARSLAAYKKAEQLNPKSYDIHLQLGHIHKITGNFGEALKSYEQAALLNPSLGDAKHEIRNVVQMISSFDGAYNKSIGQVFTSIEQLITFLKNQPEEQDIFMSYFRSVSGR